MATCIECLHFNVCESFCGGIPRIMMLGNNAERDCGYYKPTADVVPKSEVEELICKLECLLCHVTGGRLSKHTYDLATMETVATDCINETYNDGYGEGYKDCAREIFADIEKKSCVISETNHSTGSTRVVSYQISAERIAELKKKYTEGEQYGN